MMELKIIDRTNRGRGRLNVALSIYRETILPEAQNPERQILYWIEHGKDGLADEFRCFAIQRGNAIVGYLQYSYFREEHIFFFEYLCIRDPKRAGLVPSEAVKSIEDFLTQNYQSNFTLVFEVAQKRTSSTQWEPDKKLITYFKRLGFRKVEFDYHYPILQTYDGDVSYPADLMIRLPARRTVVTSCEMRTILRCIYFKHYLRWDRPFLDFERFSEREHLINALYSKQVEGIGGNDTFGTSGDDKRYQLNRFKSFKPRLSSLLDRIFGPKLPRLIIVIIVMLVAQRLLGSIWLLVPFVLAVAAIYCLAEDTDASRKLFVVILSRLRLVRQRSS
jgi:hypothetical protein